METQKYDNIIENVAKTILHDFMNCFSYIRCYCELIQSSEMSKEELNEFARNSINEIDKLSRMTNEIMEYMKQRDAFEFKQHPVSEIMNDIVSTIKDDLVAKDIKLTSEVIFDGDITVDADRLKHAILKVIANSLEAMQRGGILTLSAKISGNDLEIKIKDTGSGIPKTVRPRIFEPFLVSGKKGRLGLGLTFARRVIEAHSGEISFQTFVDGEEQGRAPGTVFMIKLPLKKE